MSKQQGAAGAACARSPGPEHDTRFAIVADGNVGQREEDVALAAVVAHRRVAEPGGKAAFAASA